MTSSSDIAISTFHLGFLLSTAFVCATIHVMLLIIEPDLTERDTFDAWLRQIRFLQFMLFLPLVGFFMTHSEGGKETAVWFACTAVVSALLFTPIEMHFKGVRGKTPPLPEEVKAHFQEVSKTHMRILMGNFALGLLMGAAILAPFAVALAVIALCHSIGLITDAQAESALKLTPALCSLCVPVLMPLAFLVLGPSILRITQGALYLKNTDAWKARWALMGNRARSLGYKGVERIELLELPWNKAGFKNAFYIGLPSKLNPFMTGVFVVRGIDELLHGEELDFLLSHEAAHGLHRHAMKRMNLGVALFIFFAITQVMAVMLKAPLLSLALAIGCFAWGYHLIRKQNEIQEMEADVIAVNIMGASAEAMDAAVSALTKLDTFNLHQMQPFTQKRVAYLKTIFATAKRRPDADDYKRAA